MVEEHVQGTEQSSGEQTLEKEEVQPVESAVAEIAESEGEPQPDPLIVLSQELEETRAKAAEYLDGWQRARAELANARKRFQREQEQAYDQARGDVIVHLLPIVDDFERAFETLPHNLSGLTWIQGIWLIHRKLQLLLEQQGVTPVEAVGQKFDPFIHQAVIHEPSEEVEEGIVISELQKGYKLDDRVLRPAMVRVSSGPPLAVAGEEEKEPGAAEAEPHPSTPPES